MICYNITGPTKEKNLVKKEDINTVLCGGCNGPLKSKPIDGATHSIKLTCQKCGGFYLGMEVSVKEHA